MINYNGKEYLKKNMYIQQSFYCMAIITIVNQTIFQLKKKGGGKQRNEEKEKILKSKEF